MPERNRHAVPTILSVWLEPFRSAFTAPTWKLVMTLVMGTLLVPGRRTVASALRIVGLDQVRHFACYHRVLNRCRWSSLELSARLLRRLVAAFVPADEPIIVGLDDSIERRWGLSIKARGIYRDPVRSSQSHFVKTSGLRWLSVMLLTDIPCAGRCWALPFLTALAPSERYWQKYHPERLEPKKLTDWARQTLKQVARWLPGRRVIAVGDSSFASIELLDEMRRHCVMVTRLRLDAGLYDPPPRRTGRPGRPRVRGLRQPTLKQRLTDPEMLWRRLRVTNWYGRSERTLDTVTGTALCSRPVEPRWVPRPNPLRSGPRPRRRT